MTNHGSVSGRFVALRPMTLGDVEPFVSYWHDGGADLAHLGIDPAKLGTAAEIRQRFANRVLQRLGHQVFDTR